MRPLLIASVLVVALIDAAPAGAGCWATAGLAPPPAGTTAGKTWTAEVTVLQHGRNPLPNASDAEPTVTIVHAASGRRETFTAKSTAPDKGLYAARVVFPFGGKWAYEVFDDFPVAECAQTHEFGAVQIGGPAASSVAGGSAFPLWPLLGAAGAGLVAIAGLVYPFRHRRSRVPAAT